MKIIHTADLHLDSRLTTHLPPDMARQRRRELLLAFEKMLDYADRNGVKAVLIAGDLFDSRNISALARNTVYEEICKRPEMTFYYLRGNHDADSFLGSLDEIPENLKLFGTDWTYYPVELPGGYRLMIAGVELTADNSATIYDTLELSAEDCNIVMLHGQEADTLSKDHAENIRLSALRNRGIDYLALGHIHRYKSERLDARGYYCYSGCLEARGFDESGEHGFVLLEIDDRTGECRHTFVPQAERRFRQEEVDISDCMTTAGAAEEIRHVLKEREIPARDMLKLILSGTLAEEAEIDAEMLTEQFRQEYYFCKVYDKTGRKMDYESYQLEKSLRGEFVRMVQADAGLSQEEKADVIRYGLTVLRGERLE